MAWRPTLHHVRRAVANATASLQLSFPAEVFAHLRTGKYLQKSVVKCDSPMINLQLAICVKLQSRTPREEFSQQYFRNAWRRLGWISAARCRAITRRRPHPSAGESTVACRPAAAPTTQLQRSPPNVPTGPTKLRAALII
ncbi:hypothetical protein DFJ73DRAFT_760203 [Zopfochytrium polystomum]|nr:hypothetical protein DFJ73DRAFT_760203 [Zopfochytrium polystomum]